VICPKKNATRRRGIEPTSAASQPTP